jgi:molybdopterin-guanine dinucleotide biosynthesis protein A
MEEDEIEQKKGAIAGVVLAGGEGKRFNGIIKAKIIIDGETIISRIINIFDSIFEEKLLVTNSPEKFSEYADSCIIFGDKYLKKGPLGGIHSALIETSREAVFVVGGDMPFLQKDLIMRQINFFEKNSCDAVIPVIGQSIEPLHGIYKKSVAGLLEEYLKSDNNYSIREFFKEINICYFPVEDSEESMQAFTNINTPEDLATYFGSID